MTSSGVPVGDTTLLQRLKELDEKATPGNWYESHGWLESDPDTQVAQGFGDDPQWLADAALITGLRNALPAVVTLIEAAQRHIEDEAADAIAVRALETDENVIVAQQHQRGTRERANESFGVLCAALAPFVGEATQ